MKHIDITIKNLIRARDLLKANGIWIDVGMLANARPDVDLARDLWQIHEFVIPTIDKLDGYEQKLIYLENVDSYLTITKHKNDSFYYITYITGILADSELFQLYLMPSVACYPEEFIEQKKSIITTEDFEIDFT